VHLNCPFIKESLDSEDFKEYVTYLVELCFSPGQREILKNNPQVIQPYEETQDIRELKGLLINEA
jgi:hypothetical protein